ncbi:MAG: hypothetical protein JSV24_08955 [Bacteroidales bacterium]|nr:MAG: hypothetical protein JSV24_08955 [Bacteroidales bacterium]
MKIKSKMMIPVWILVGSLLLQFTGDEDSFRKLISEKLEVYKKNNPGDIVYIHTDKDVYSPGDELNYKVYIKDLYSSKALPASKILTIFLNDPEGNSVIVKTHEIQNGRAYGKFELNQSLADGKYTLIGFTELMQQGKPENVFTKKLVIHKIYLPSTIVHLSVPDTVYGPNEEVEITVDLLSPNGKPVRKSFTCNIYLNGDQIISSENKTDRSGRSMIRTKLPDYKDNSLISAEIIVERSGITDKNHILLPIKGLPCYIDFFPESGALVHGLESKVGFIARDHFGNPLEIEGHIIDQNDNVRGDFKSIYKGLGYFTVIPDKNLPVKVRITKPPGITDMFQLPAISNRGIVLTFNEGINDILSFSINANLENTNAGYHIIAEQDGQIVWNETLTIKDRVDFEIPTADFARGILRIAVFDSFGNYLAQRSVYLHKTNSNVGIRTDRNEYVPGEQVNLDIEILNTEGFMELAELSVAVTDANLNPDWNSFPDLYSSFMLGRAIKRSPFPPAYFNSPTVKMKRDIDCLMLTLLEDKFNWNEILSAREDEPRRTANISFMGTVQEYYRSDILSRIYEEIEKVQFFGKYILKYNLIFPEYYSVNRRYFVKSQPKNVRVDKRNWIQGELASGTSILDVIRKLKNYQLLNNKIVFYGLNSILNQEGALFVFDGIKMGSDIRVLGTLNPHDIENIRIITNPTEVLMYTGFNPIGIIEITTKGDELIKDEVDEVSQEYNPTLYWNPFVVNPEEKGVSISFKSMEIKSSYNIVVQGIDERGNPLFGTGTFSVF